MSFIPLLPGSGGANIGTDQVAGSPNIDYQVFKIGVGSAGVAPVLVDATHGLPVSLVSGGLAALADENTFTVGSTQGVSWLALFNDSATATSGQAVAPRVSGARQLLTAPQGVVNGGAIPAVPVVAAATTNVSSVKTSAGTLYSAELFNSGAALAYLKVFDTTATPTMGTTIPKKNIPIPFSTNGAGVVISFGAAGISFVNGIWIAITLNPSNTDNTALGASPGVIVNLSYF